MPPKRPPPQKKKGPSDSPEEAFNRLRQAFDVIKEKHSDPWSWHEYLSEEPPEPEIDPDEDPEIRALRPRPRRNIERLKAHLLTCIAELNRAAAAADMCYFHMCTNPAEMKPCVVILGTSGDIDSDLLLNSEDASPQKILAAMQVKLDKAHARIAELEDEVDRLRENLADQRALAEERWIEWQRSATLAEDAITRLHNTTTSLKEASEREKFLRAGFSDLYHRFVRASRLMVYKARQALRDKIFYRNPEENAFYAFHGFMHVLRLEKEERIRREHEAMRDAVEFALRNEVRFLLAEKQLSSQVVQRLAVETGGFKRDRRELAKRILRKHRPYEPLEFCL